MSAIEGTTKPHVTVRLRKGLALCSCFSRLFALLLSITHTLNSTFFLSLICFAFLIRFLHNSFYHLTRLISQHSSRITKKIMLVEDQRLLHEDLERLEQGISDRILEEPRNVSDNLLKRCLG